MMRLSRIWTPALAVLFFLAVSDCSGAESNKLRTGDIIFQTSRSAQSQAVQLATRSSLSHMGLIIVQKGKPYVLEAASTVRLTPLKIWKDRGVDGRFRVKRLKDADSRLTTDTLNKLETIALGYVGRSYDPYFEWSDDRMYCSELVWKIYNLALGLEIGTLQRFEDFDLAPSVVREKIKERFGEDPPLKEKVISPVQMYNSPLLKKVR